MNCTTGTALTKAHKIGSRLTCCAIATSILTWALGTILAVTSLSTVLTKCALWTQLTAVCAPVPCCHKNALRNTVSKHNFRNITHLHNPLTPQPNTGSGQLNHFLPHTEVSSSLSKLKLYTPSRTNTAHLTHPVCLTQTALLIFNKQ